jgi:hypothetical protein
MVKDGIYSKWLIHGFSDYCVGSDKKLYRFPFKSNHKWYQLREVKVQYPNRFRIDGMWRTKEYLKGRVYLNDNPTLLIKSEDECPF